MSNSIRYEGDGRGIWLIPFPFGSASDLGVARIGPDGISRSLDYGSDYTIIGNNLICVIPCGHSLSIWLRTNPESAALGQEQRIARELGPEYQPQAQAANEAAPATASAVDDLDSRYAQIRAELERIVQDKLVILNNRQDYLNSEAAAKIQGYLQQARDYTAENIADIHSRTLIARQYAGQASLFRQMPGVAMVAKAADIPCSAAGLFVINPHLEYAPTPFMGVWPVNCPEEANWDGVFFIGQPYDPPITLPPGFGCPPPLNVENAGDSDDWQPCWHYHQPCACFRPVQQLVDSSNQPASGSTISTEQGAMDSDLLSPSASGTDSSRQSPALAPVPGTDSNPNSPGIADSNPE